MKIDWVISASAHAAILGFCLVSFSAKPLEAPPESLPVDLVTAKQFSQVMAGTRKAPKAAKPKPLVEKVADHNKTVEDPTPKITKQHEIKAAKAQTPPPPKLTKQHEIKQAKLEPAPLPPRRPKSLPKQTQAKPKPKIDPIAEALKKDQARRNKAKEEQARRAKREAEQRRREHKTPKYDPAQIAALLDKRAPQRHEATGRVLSTASLGAVDATSAHLSESELDGLRRRLRQCWSPPVGAANIGNLKVTFRVLFNPDGSIRGTPVLVEGPANEMGPVLADSAKRALLRCQPYAPPLLLEHYDQWKDIEITFDPRDMMGG